MKHRIHIQLLLLICIFAVSSCNKDQWKETVETDITLESVNTEVYFGANVLKIDTIIITIETMVLDGDRLQADNIHLSETIDQEFILVDNSIETISTFSIPQGTYESFQFTSKIGSSVSSIQIIGTYTKPNNDVKKVVLELDYNEYLLRELVDESSDPISVDKDSPGIIQISIDPNIIFSNLNPSFWNAANTSQINGHTGIEISNSANSNIYNQIQPKIGESMSFDFD